VNHVFFGILVHLELYFVVQNLHFTNIAQLSAVFHATLW